MMDYEDKIFERRCFIVTTEKMLDLMKKRTRNGNLEIRIEEESSDVFLYMNEEDMYDEEDMAECISDETGVEIDHVFFFGDKFGGTLYFTERRLE